MACSAGDRCGDLIGVCGPYGTHWPVEAAAENDVVVVAGGLGLAPLRPALYQLLAHREKYGHVVLLYGTRSPADILYRRELELWRGRFDLARALGQLPPRLIVYGIEGRSVEVGGGLSPEAESAAREVLERLQGEIGSGHGPAPPPSAKSSEVFGIGSAPFGITITNP